MSTPTKPKRIRDFSQGRQDIYKIDPALIQVEPGYNERQDWGDIPALAESIKENDFTLLQPLIVRKNGEHIYLCDGERRYKAINHLIKQGHDIPTVLCRPERTGTTEQERLIAQIETNSGKPFTLLEKGRVYVRLQDTGLTAADIARKTQTTKTAVGNALHLIQYGSEHIIKLVTDETLSATSAIEIINLYKEDHTEQDRIAQKASAIASESGKTKITSQYITKAINILHPTTDQQQDTTTTTAQTTDSNVAETETLPTPTKPKKSDLTFELTDSEDQDHFGLNDHGVCTLPNTLTLTNAPKSWGIKELDIEYAWHKSHVISAYGIRQKEAGQSTPCSNNNPKHPDVQHAVAAAWSDLKHHLDLTEEQLTQIHTALDAVINISKAEAEEKTITAGAAIDRIKNTATTGTSQGGSGGVGEGGKASPDKRIKTLNTFLNETNPEALHTDRVNTTELILTYLEGDEPITALKSHLKGK